MNKNQKQIKPLLNPRIDRNFLSMNILTHEQIAEGVGLPLEKIEELATEVASHQSK